jgi:HK97 gp10 family phage protein
VALGSFSQSFSDAVHASITKQMRQFGTVIVDKAVQLAPKRTGALATSIHYEYNEQTYALAILVGVPYGIFQEYGTRNMHAHPYIRPALNQVAPIYGIDVHMGFNTPEYANPVLAQGPTFDVPKTLTHKQREHIRQNLKPISEHHFNHRSGNVRHATLHARHRRSH